MSLHDPFGRTINYLRLSITDRCNLSCLYCVPGKNRQSQSCQEALSFHDLLSIARAAISQGVEKIRITGGEPLLREGILDFLSELKKLPGLKRLVVTTNGIMLEQMAASLAAAGVDSLNISIDSLVAAKFRRITRGGQLAALQRGIAAAEAAGFHNLKFNVVVMRGVNDDELADFAALTLAKPYKVRFIEYMPTVGKGDGRNLTVPGDELLQRLAGSFTLLPVAKEAMAGPAVYYRIEGAVGEIGMITPMSCHFCQECNRIRVTSRGILKGCLFDNGVMDLKPLLANGDEAALHKALRQVILDKPERHHFRATAADDGDVSMMQIGG